MEMTSGAEKSAVNSKNGRRPHWTSGAKPQNVEITGGVGALLRDPITQLTSKLFLSDTGFKPTYPFVGGAARVSVPVCVMVNLKVHPARVDPLHALCKLANLHYKFGKRQNIIHGAN
jgi:hypothetical protein